jgi:squalene-hopene/tetraprenyl-beta-curcumene cyclase
MPIMRNAITGLVALTLSVLAVRATSGQAPANSRTWDLTGAAAYLDQRMDTWFSKGDKLRTGQGRTICVSCHTVIPYALARPILRRAAHVALPTPQETRLVDETIRRVDTFGSHQLLYEFEEDKKAQSRGTESVLYALILANAGATGRRDLREPTRKALAHLWETQRPDGAWDWLDFGLEPFESADATYQGAAWAALAAGMASQSSGATAGREKLVAYLHDHYADQNLYNRSWALLASSRMKGVLNRADRDALVAEIGSRQRDDGGWSLQGLGPWRWSGVAAPFHSPGQRDDASASHSDGYATGLIVYALRQAGLPADHPVVNNGLRWLRADQQAVRIDGPEWRAWRTHSLNFDREHGGQRGEPWRRLFMSDAATAFAAMALAAAE